MNKVKQMLGIILSVVIVLSCVPVAAYADSVANVTYETIHVQSGDSLWSLAEEHPIDGLSTQETSDMIRSVNHLDHGSLDAGVDLKVPARS